MADEAEYLVILQTNLRNVENTFGKASSQYLDVLEVIQNYMANVEAAPQNPAEVQTESKMPPPSFANLTFRPKPQS
ncbi:hypothetical protein FKW77_006567 [Venturia effusa]|uniref:Uncharacterized protein n=1 Tax=Venturia effusa TaxID=50376 RepID=A0A517LFP6_9PEZI|nr:hypothetical protein FKW77_006567 [Venturia effusa]